MKESKLPIIITISIVAIGFTLLIAMMLADTTDQAVMNSLVVKYKHDKDHSENENKYIYLEAHSNNGIKEITLNYRTQAGEFKAIPFSRFEETPYFSVVIPGSKKGNKIFFYIKAIDNKGNQVILPKREENGNSLYKITFEGSPTFIFKLLHVVLMLTSIIILIHCFYYSLSRVINKEENVSSKFTNLTFSWLLTFFITGFPLGGLIAWQTFGKAWSGIPFGWDITDNKTLIILIYWLAIFIPFKLKKISTDLMAKLIIAGTILTIILFIIPHSI